MTCKMLLIVLIVLVDSIKVLSEKESIDTFPFIAMVFSLLNGTIIGEVCNGYVASSRLVVTTGNCYIDEHSKSYVLLVALKDTQIHTLLRIEKWILHPYYIPTTVKMHNEVALVKTETDIDVTRIGYVELLPEESLVNVMECSMIGWKISDLDFIGQDFSAIDVLTMGKNLKTIYIHHKTMFSSIQCKAQLNLIEKQIIDLDDSFLCVKHDPNWKNDADYGTLGSLLICKPDIEVNQFYIVGLKRRQRDITKQSPELYINLRKYARYISRIVNDFDSKPIFYFCEIRVCGKKYDTYGEYCIVGDKTGCLHMNRDIKHFFPQSNANPNFILYSLSSFTLVTCVFLSTSNQ